MPEPPRALFRVEKYRSPAGDLAAYVSPSPGDGQKHSAMIWVFGGFDNSIGETAWEPASPDNDQSASAFREAGMVMMYPSFRGGNMNPGNIEAFYGEVDDLLAAAEHLAKKDYVDPNRIYLGGHSTGGTLVMLAAAATDRFRAVFAFGPVDNVYGYGDDVLPFDSLDYQELILRSPIQWVHKMNFACNLIYRAQPPASSLSVNWMLHVGPVSARIFVATSFVTGARALFTLA